ncbi:MAG: hypothetical protein IKQ25_03765 [Lachnospiraceae bacterium]|nr:hypothetical protein [Lachnospiraceae bacterium]
MRELGRVFNRKVLLILAILCAMNLILFLLCIDPEKTITLGGEELQGYLERYPVFLKNTVENGSKMGMLSMYQKGYGSESLKKTTELYRALEGTQVTAGENRGVVLLVQYQLTDLFLLIFLFLIVMEFQAERKKGLVYLVRSTIGGRSKLYLQRMAILAFSTVVGALCFYGGNLIGILFGFGLGDLSRSLQSLPEFMKCPYSITIGAYLFRSLLLKMTGCFGVAVLFYTLIGCFNTVMAYFCSAVLVTLEVLTGILIPPISSWNILRYVNLFTLIRCEEFYEDAIFVGVFGKAKEALPVTLTIFGILFLLVLVAGYAIHGRKYVIVSHRGEKIFDAIARWKEKLSLQHTLFGWEAYKLLMKQKGILILLAVFLVHLTLSMQYEYYYPVDIYQRMYYIEYQGDITEERVASAQASMDILKMAEEGMLEKIEKYKTEVPYPVMKISGLQESITTIRWKQQSLQPIIDDLNSGLDYVKRTGHRITLVAPFYYDLLLNKDEKTRTRASFLEIIALLATLAGIFAFDRQNHVEQIMHSSYRGRKPTTVLKLILVLLYSSFSCGLIHLIQLWRVSQVDAGLPELENPVQGIQFMREFAIYVPIWGYLVLLFLVRMGMACLLGLVISVISKRSGDVITAMGVSCFVVIILVLLGTILPAAWWLSPIKLLGGTYLR